MTKDEREESTRIHSQSELDEMVRKSRAASVAVVEHDEFDAHTQVGKLDELVARTKTSDGPASQTSAHVVRRASSPAIATPTRAVGSQADIPKRDDDAAFEEYEVDTPAPQTFGAAARPLPLPPPPQSMSLPVIARPPVLPQARSSIRWGAIAWVALLAAMIGIGTVGYIRIRQLETQLAAAQAKLAK